MNDLQATGARLSTYARNLPRDNPNVFRRYLEKIKLIQFNDPYVLKYAERELPLNLSTGHVVEYLLNFRSPYTNNPMKNTRSLEGYKKFEAGFVNFVTGKIINGHFVVMGKVKTNFITIF